MLKDIDVLINSVDQNGEAQVTISWNGMILDDYLKNSNSIKIVTGRIVRDSGGIVTKTKEGKYCTPILYENEKKELVASMSSSINYYSAIDESIAEVKRGNGYVRFPTLVNNSYEQPRYFNLYAFEESAKMLAKAKKGDSIEAIIMAKPKLAKVAGKEYPIYFVKKLAIYPKEAEDYGAEAENHNT